MDKTQVKPWNNVAPTIDFTLELDNLILDQFISADSKILDYGCGYGRIANKLYEDGYKNIVGYDTSPEMIKRGEEEFPNLNLNTYDFPKLPCDDNIFDAAICCAVLTCIPDVKVQETIIKELKRVLKPSGVLYIAEFAVHPTIDYDEHGMFKTKFDVTMKHFIEDDFLALLDNFEKRYFKKNESKSISGSAHSSFHYLGLNM